MTSDFKGFNTIFYFKDYLKKEKIDINNIGSSYLRDFKNTKSLSINEQLSAIDFINQLPNQFLYKVDRISMMNGIEARVPLVDIRLIKLVFSINQKLRFKRNPSKRIFRDSVDIPNYLKFTPKRGFGTPISIWLNESKPNIKSNILSAPFLDFFMLDKKNVKNLLNINKYSQIESYSLWKILCLSIWFNKVFNSEY